MERDLTPVATAATEFGVSTDVIFKYLRLGRLTRFKKGMDRRTYVDRGELKKILRPRVVKPKPAPVRSGYVRTTDRFRRSTKRLGLPPQRKGESDKDYAARMDAARAEAHERLRRQRR